MTKTALRTGKLPARHDERDLQFDAYVDWEAVLPKIPQSWAIDGHVTDWPMMGNGPDSTLPEEWTAARNGAGDCVWAEAAHTTELWTSEHGPEAAVTGTDAITWYKDYTGYNPATGEGDGGTDMRKAMIQRRKGLQTTDGRTFAIAAFAALKPKSIKHVYAAAYLFGAVSIGIEFPDSAMRQFDAGEPWDVVEGEPPPTDGHCIPIVQLENGDLGCVTWAKIQPMTLRFFEKYCDEAYVMLSRDHVDPHSGKSPEGFNFGAMEADLKKVIG